MILHWNIIEIRHNLTLLLETNQVLLYFAFISLIVSGMEVIACSVFHLFHFYFLKIRTNLQASSISQVKINFHCVTICYSVAITCIFVCLVMIINFELFSGSRLWSKQPNKSQKCWQGLYFLDMPIYTSVERTFFSKTKMFILKVNSFLELNSPHQSYLVMHIFSYVCS